MRELRFKGNWSQQMWEKGDCCNATCISLVKERKPFILVWLVIAMCTVYNPGHCYVMDWREEPEYFVMTMMDMEMAMAMAMAMHCAFALLESSLGSAISKGYVQYWMYPFRVEICL
jgi:hypothetical protein